MKSHRLIFTGFASLFTDFLPAVCASSHTSPCQPGPVAGQAVGAVVVAGYGVASLLHSIATVVEH
jgi:hypothetical protein